MAAVEWLKAVAAGVFSGFVVLIAFILIESQRYETKLK